MSIAAIDFETANRFRYSACQVAAVRISGGRVVESFQALLDPQGPFEGLQMGLHGIRPADVVGAPTLAEVWPQLASLLARADRVVAHNAPFDRSVFEQTLRHQGTEPPVLPWECTVIRSRRLLPDLPNHRLPTLCDHFGVSLTQHHDALADALATARLAVALDRLQVCGVPVSLPSRPPLRLAA